MILSLFFSFNFCLVFPQEILSLKQILFHFELFRFVSLWSISFRFISFRFGKSCFVSVNFVSICFVSFRFDFVSHFIGTLLTEELLEKIMLAKTKHKKLWKFYWNPFCYLRRVMDNATVSSLYCIALYDNCIALNDKIQNWRHFSKNCFVSPTHF
jgi:hypothetical protein